MTQQRRIAGMTPMQIGILVGLAALVCILFCIVGVLVLGRGNLSFGQAPVSTPASQMTSTPYVLPTVTPTITFTPVSYEALVPEGWKQFKTSLIEIWLPSVYKPVKTNELDKFKTKGSITELILEGESETPLFRNLVMVHYQPLNGENIDLFLDRELPSVSPDYIMTSRKKDTLNTAEVIVITLETRSSNVTGNILAYVFVDGGTVWFVTYAAEINQYYTVLPDFEKSAATFRVVR